MATTVGTIVIGDELLKGRFPDENGRYLVAQLRKIGVPLRRMEFIGDDLGEIAATVRRHSESCDVVITSGGIGPTHDDLTMAGISAGFQRDLAVHPILEKLLTAHFGGPLTAPQRRLARTPDGARVHRVDGGWPVIEYRNIYILPGVPTLFRRCFDSIRGHLEGSSVIEARIYCYASETEIADVLSALAQRCSTLQFGSYPRVEGNDHNLVITIEGEDVNAVTAAMRELSDALSARVVRVTSPEDAEGKSTDREP